MNEAPVKPDKRREPGHAARTKNALQRARERGVVLGRPALTRDADTVEQVLKLRAGGAKQKAIAEAVEISVSSVRRILARES